MPPAEVGRAGSSRSTPRWLVLAAAALLAARVVTGLAEAGRPPRPGNRVSWRPPAAGGARQPFDQPGASR